MRISLADSLMNGFKKWSDAQRLKSELAALDTRQGLAPERASSAGKEGANDGSW